LFVGVEEMDLADKARALERERRVGTNPAAATDDADFHVLSIGSAVRNIVAFPR
jgi:hypothetical protein